MSRETQYSYCPECVLVHDRAPGHVCMAETESGRHCAHHTERSDVFFTCPRKKCGVETRIEDLIGLDKPEHDLPIGGHCPEPNCGTVVERWGADENPFNLLLKRGRDHD